MNGIEKGPVGTLSMCRRPRYGVSALDGSKRKSGSAARAFLPTAATAVMISKIIVIYV